MSENLQGPEVVVVGPQPVEFGVCPVHGSYPTQFRYPDGSTRYSPEICRPCARQESAFKGLGLERDDWERFLRSSFDTYLADGERQKVIKTYLQNYANTFDGTGHSLILTGTPGTGKTHLCYAILSHIFLRGFVGVLMGSYAIIGALRQTWSTEYVGISYEDKLRLLRDLDLLVIDEVGAQYQSSSSEKVELTRIIDDRYRKLKSTILISNYGLEAIEQAIGMAAFDRMREGGKVIYFDWESHRKKGKVI